MIIKVLRPLNSADHPKHPLREVSAPTLCSTLPRSAKYSSCMVWQNKARANIFTSNFDIIIIIIIVIYYYYLHHYHQSSSLPLFNYLSLSRKPRNGLAQFFLQYFCNILQRKRNLASLHWVVGMEIKLIFKKLSAGPVSIIIGKGCHRQGQGKFLECHYRKSNVPVLSVCFVFQIIIFKYKK